MPPKFLTNTKMGQLVARLLGKSELTVKDGKVSLTDEERDIIKKNYGEGFLKKLESVSLDDEEEGAASARELFDAAVEHHTEALNAELADKDAIIAKLQQDIQTLCDLPEPAPVSVKTKASSGKTAFKINMSAKHNAAVASALASGNPEAFQMATGGVDIADLKAEFTMAVPPDVKLDILTKRIYNGFADAKYMTQVMAKGTDYIASTAIMSEVSQQFTNKWTPKGSTKFTPIRIPYRRHKINVEIDPTEIIDSWLVFLYQQGKSPDQHPLVHYIINTHILPKVVEDITFSMIAKGKFEKVTDVKTNDEGSAAAQSMDGYETILVEGMSDPDCKINFYKNPQDVLALSGQALLDYVDQFTKAISPLFAKNLPVYCSREFLEAYKKADFEVYGKYTGSEIGNQVRFSKFTLIALESMYNSPILFATPKENFALLVDYSKAGSCINDIQKQDYIVKIFGEYSLSVGFKIAEAVYASVPTGYTPSEMVITDATGVGDAWVNGGGTAAVSDEIEGA